MGTMTLTQFASRCRQCAQAAKKLDDTIAAGLAHAIAEKLKKYLSGTSEFAALSPVTISGGWVKNVTTGKPVHIQGKGHARQLNDSGASRDSVRKILMGSSARVEITTPYFFFVEYGKPDGKNPPRAVVQKTADLAEDAAPSLISQLLMDALFDLPALLSYPLTSRWSL